VKPLPAQEKIIKNICLHALSRLVIQSAIDMVAPPPPPTAAGPKSAPRPLAIQLLGIGKAKAGQRNPIWGIKIVAYLAKMFITPSGGWIQKCG